MTLVYDKWGVQVHHGDCLDIMRGMPPESVHSVVTDPPAAISFMSKEWDGNRGGREQWVEWLAERMREAHRVLKPGGHALVWALPRTAHWTAWALEDAGFEIRDCVTHLFGGAMPKSLDVSKAIDKRPGVHQHREFAAHLADRRQAAGLSRADVSEQVVGSRTGACWNWEHHQFPEARWWPALRDLLGLDPVWDEVVAEVDRAVVGNGLSGAVSIAFARDSAGSYNITAPATDAARQWAGWGTNLKPGSEMWWLCRKPFPGTVAANVLEHGTGALNIEGCRVEARGRPHISSDGGGPSVGVYGDGLHGSRCLGTFDQGRWPPNVVLSHTALIDPVSGEVIGDACEQGCVEGCPVAELDRQSGHVASTGTPDRPAKATTYSNSGGYSGRLGKGVQGPLYSDTGGASRFYPTFRYEAKAPASERPRVNGLSHSTVKPVGLVKWLSRLITPPGGIVFDPFAGTGVTGQAARAEGFKAILVDDDPQAMVWIRARLDGQPRTEAPKPGCPVVEPDLDLFSIPDPDTVD